MGLFDGRSEPARSAARPRWPSCWAARRCWSSTPRRLPAACRRRARLSSARSGVQDLRRRAQQRRRRAPRPDRARADRARGAACRCSGWLPRDPRAATGRTLPGPGTGRPNARCRRQLIDRATARVLERRRRRPAAAADDGHTPDQGVGVGPLPGVAACPSERASPSPATRRSASTTRTTWICLRPGAPRSCRSARCTTRRCPRDVDGVYLGGGFPELFAAATLPQHARCWRPSAMPPLAVCRSTANAAG